MLGSYSVCTHFVDDMGAPQRIMSDGMRRLSSWFITWKINALPAMPVLNRSRRFPS